MKDSTRALLRDSLGRDDLTIEELVSRAEALLAVLAPRQTRYKVADRPDVRTIRYYTSQRLLPKPVSYEGGRARYGGGHLLRLLLIKKMQAEHHTLQHIARALHGAGDEQILGALLPAGAAGEAGERAVPAPAAAGAPAQADIADSGTRLRRFALAPDVMLDVPEAVFTDPARRRALAASLESLARTLRGRGRAQARGKKTGGKR